MACIFCESQFADPILPANRQKICLLFDVSLNGKRLLHDGKICTRCQLNVDMIESAAKLKAEMNQCLQERLATNLENKVIIPPSSSPLVFNYVVSPTPVINSITSRVAELNGVSALAKLAPPPSADSHSTASEKSLVLDSSSSSSTFICVNCGSSFKEHGDLVAHNEVCTGSGRTNGDSSQAPMTCERCGQSLKYQSPDDRYKHILRCQGHGLRRGRPSTGIFNCPKCGLSLKNRMNHDRLNHVERCTGSGLKRGRPSLKTVEKHQCDKCGRNLWSRDQLELHVSKCDGTHVERRGRKPGDNTCMVCGENLVYRHILKKHLRQAHGINPQNLDDSVIAALKTDDSSEINTPYKRLLLQQIQQQLANSSPPADLFFKAESTDQHECIKCHTSFPDRELLMMHMTSCAENNQKQERKQERPCRYVPVAGMYTCGQCNKRFEHKLLFENHSCFHINGHAQLDERNDSSNDGLDNEELSDEEGKLKIVASEAGSSMDDYSMDEDAGSSQATDVVSRISVKAALTKRSSVKGLAQVVSDLMGANKTAPELRQSIST